MNVGRRSQMIEIMNFCEKNHFTYNITWTFDRQYEVQFMFPEHQYAVKDFLAAYVQSVVVHRQERGRSMNIVTVILWSWVFVIVIVVITLLLIGG